LYPKKLAQFISAQCKEKKGIKPLVLDVSKISDITRFFIIVSGNSSRHVDALADYVVERTKERGLSPWHIERDGGPTWVVIDHGDVITHIFYSHIRSYYNLERLWGDAPIVK